MLRAIRLAHECRAEDDRVHPLVGVVVVRRNRVLGTAYRGEVDAGDHAEFTALDKKPGPKSFAGTTVYTTLEPCTARNHPKVPCASRLIDHKVRRVVVGMLDPNQNICGRVIRRLREARIALDLFPSDLMERVEEQNRDFTRAQETSSQGYPLFEALPEEVVRKISHDNMMGLIEQSRKAIVNYLNEPPSSPSSSPVDLSHST